MATYKLKRKTFSFAKLGAMFTKNAKNVVRTKGKAALSRKGKWIAGGTAATAFGVGALAKGKPKSPTSSNSY